MLDLAVGDRIHIEFDATVESLVNVNGGSGDKSYHLGACAIVSDDRGTQHAIYTGAAPRIAKVIAPKNWPPKVGDVWEADGTSWFCCESVLGGHPIMRPETFTAGNSATVCLDEFKSKRGVKLVYRKGR